MQARDIMTPDVISVGPETPIAEIVHTMLANRISAVPVLDAGRIVGIVSEGDLLRRAEIHTDAPPSRWLELLKPGGARAADYVKTHGKRAAEVMTRDVITVADDAPLEQVARLLASHRIRRVPVMRGEKLVGIVSRADLVQALGSRMRAEPGGAGTDDRRIRDALLAELSRQSWAPGHAGVTVSDGVVHVWGVIDSDRRRRALVVAAENIPGVKRVEDHTARTVAIDPMNRPNWPTPAPP